MAIDNYDPSTALTAYYPSREERRPARLWATEKLLHDMAELGMVEFFEGGGTNPTILSGYGITKLWLRVSSGVTEAHGEVRAYDGAGDATDIANWPELTRGAFLDFLGVRPDLGRFETRMDVIAAIIAPSVNGVTTLGYGTAGDGGAAIYKRAESEPSHAGKLQSADGAWWEIARGQDIRLEMFGVVSGLAVSDGVAEANVDHAQEALDFCATVGQTLFAPAQFYVFKDNGLRIPSSVHVVGSGTGFWDIVFPSRPKTWTGTNFVFKGTGTKNVTVTGITSMKPGGGWRPDPDNPSEYYKLTSFMNDDATGTTPATPRAFSVAIRGNEYSATDWGLHGIRVVPWIGDDGISDYSDTSNSSLSDEWDVGVLLLDNEYVSLTDGETVGHWRIAGTALLSPGWGQPGRSEQNLIRNWKTQGVRGLLIRGGDRWGVDLSETTSTTLEIVWSEESYWPSTGGSFEGLGTDSATYTYTGTTRVGDNLRFNGISPDPTSVAPTQIRNPNRGSGWAHCQGEKVFAHGLDHESGNDSESFGLPISMPFEISGFPMRGWHFQNSKAQTQYERAAAYFHDVSDFVAFDMQFEGPGAYVIATPAVGAQSWAAAPCIDTRNMRLYDGILSTSIDSRLFTPRSIFDDGRQINPLDEIDSNFLLRALSGQDFKIELASGKDLHIQDSAESDIFSIDEATHVVSINIDSTSDAGLRIINEADGSNIPTLHLESTTPTPADGDQVSIRFYLPDSGGNRTEYARINGRVVDVTNGSEDGGLTISLVDNGSISTKLLLTGSALSPFADGGLALGTGALKWNGGVFGGPVRMAVYDVAGAPDASTAVAGAVIYVSNGAAGSPILAFSNGTSWLRVDTAAPISAT